MTDEAAIKPTPPDLQESMDSVDSGHAIYLACARCGAMHTTKLPHTCKCGHVMLRANLHCPAWDARWAQLVPGKAGR